MTHLIPFDDNTFFGFYYYFLKMYFKAEEISASKRSASSRLLIAVMAEDVSPPVLQVTSAIGKMLSYNHATFHRKNCNDSTYRLRLVKFDSPKIE